MFTVKGINRLKILQDAIDRNLHPGQAAEMLGITPRHCRRLLHGSQLVYKWAWCHLIVHYFSVQYISL
ncbi:hypothetical protein CHT59_04750 [Salmonella enterica subsp. enterica serovar Typhimurium]|nr:hypothetical protein [Salmonella enterica subsp. enterica serovar Typhimurium]